MFLWQIIPILTFEALYLIYPMYDFAGVSERYIE